MKEYRAGIYLRLSREHAEENNSIEAQREITSQYALKNGYKIEREYVDNGYSGILESRPALDEMLIDITTGLINMVIVKDISRLTRDKNKTGWYTEIFFPNHDVRFISVTELIDSGERYEIDDTIMLRGMANQYYIADISKKIRANKQAMKQTGKYVEHAVPYGYRKSSKDKHKVVIDTNVANNIKTIYRMYEEGNSGMQIARYLNANQIQNPSQYLKMKNMSKHWSAETVLAILSNPFYIGNTVMNQYCTDYLKKTCKKNKRENWLIKENTHKAIITKEQYEKVQLIKKSRTSQKKKKHNYLLKDLIYCGDCKHKLQYKYGEKNSGFICNKAYKQVQPCKNKIWILEKELNQIVINQIKRKFEILETNELVKRILLYRKANNQEEKEIEKIERKKKLLYEQKCKGEIALEEFKEKYSKFQEEIKQYQKKIESSTHERIKEKEIQMQVKQLKEGKGINSILLKEIINRIELEANHTIKIIFK